MQMLLTKIEELLKEIYQESYEECFMKQFEQLLVKWQGKSFPKGRKPTENTAYLITYGDSIYEKNGEAPLATLHKFLSEQVGDAISDVHLLPMFPFTSDDGFSVTDYREINSELGGWGDIDRLSGSYRLMFDFVANHVSQHSKWFCGYLADEPQYREYFIERNDDFDSAKVVRPRTSPLFHEYEGKNGKKTAWTTFSEDQVDVNFRHFPLFLEMCDILLFYLQQGGSSIRLDAIGFIWKESATACIHLPKAHKIIRVWRLLADYFCPAAQIITETNVPHKENISYFGNGDDEAHMVYQFALPPLVLHTLTVHNSAALSAWAKGIDRVSDSATWFNFLASHDGIGMRPVEDILSSEECQALADKTLANGGRVSYKNNADGSQSVYELNINYFDALLNRDEDLTVKTKVQKFLAAQFILLSLVGVPAVYIHSLLGSRNDYKGLEESGINRRINREKLEMGRLLQELKTDAVRQAVFGSLKKMLQARSTETAFSPYAKQEVLSLGEEVFAVRRYDEAGNEVLCIVNITTAKIRIENEILMGRDMMSNSAVDGHLKLDAYGFRWIRKQAKF